MKVKKVIKKNKSSKNKPKAKKTAAKKAAPKQPAKKKATAAPVRPAKPIPLTRSPQRKVLGSDKFLAKTALAVEIAALDPAPEPAPVLQVVKDIPRAPLAPIARIPWQKVPANFPPQIRFLISMAENESRAASAWPFPYAKFLSQLPEKLCGQGLAVLLLDLDFSLEEIQAKTNLSPDFLTRLLEQERENLLELFSTNCPEMYRKLQTQLTGKGLTIDSLIERYFVAKVDRSFQLTIGAVVLRALAC